MNDLNDLCYNRIYENQRLKNRGDENWKSEEDT